MRGTHGLGDAPRDRQKVRGVATQGGSASRTGAPAKAKPEAVRPSNPARGGTSRPEDESDEAAIEEEHAYEHNLATRTTPGPGPKDHDAGSGRAKDLDERHRRHKD